MFILEQKQIIYYNALLKTIKGAEKMRFEPI